MSTISRRVDNDNKYLPKDFQASDARELRSGDLTILYERGFLRSICFEETEIIRMIYFALRDHNWRTIDIRVKNEKIFSEEDRFIISYDAYQFWKGERIMTWHVRIEGLPGSSVVFSIDGVFDRPFLRNRAGFCVLHPLREVLDQPCEVTHPDGSVSKGNFPVYISPHQPFKNIRKLEWTTVDGVKARLDFQGDIFEMEDQRNWTDASFKTYCTPLSLPFPVQMNPGDSIRQKVSLSIVPETKIARNVDSGESTEVQLTPDPDLLSPWPRIGSCVPLDEITLSDRIIKRLSVSGLDHIRADILLSDPDCADRIKHSFQYSRETAIPIHLALYFSLDPEDEWRFFMEYVRDESITPASVSILTLEAPVTPLSVLSILPKIKAFFPGIPIGFGTPYYFTELNRNRPQDWVGLDFIVFSSSPQVHAFDTASMVETFEGQEATVESGRQFLPGLPVHVSPVSLFPRFNPDATAGGYGNLLHVNPPDERQYSLFVAGWTLGCLSALAKQKVSLIDFYEVAGSRGLCSSETVSPPYLIMRWLQTHAGRKYFSVSCKNPKEINCLGMACFAGRYILIANHSRQEQTANVPGFNLVLHWSMDKTNILSQIHEGGIKEINKPLEESRVILPPHSVVALRLS